MREDCAETIAVLGAEDRAAGVVEQLGEGLVRGRQDGQRLIGERDLGGFCRFEKRREAEGRGDDAEVRRGLGGYGLGRGDHGRGCGRFTLTGVRPDGLDLEAERAGFLVGQRDADGVDLRRIDVGAWDMSLPKL